MTRPPLRMLPPFPGVRVAYTTTCAEGQMDMAKTHCEDWASRLSSALMSANSHQDVRYKAKMHLGAGQCAGCGVHPQPQTVKAPTADDLPTRHFDECSNYTKDQMHDEPTFLRSKICCDPPRLPPKLAAQRE